MRNLRQSTQRSTRSKSGPNESRRTSLDSSTAASQTTTKNVNIDLVLTPSKSIPTASAKARLLRGAEAIGARLADKDINAKLTELQLCKKKGHDHLVANVKNSDLTFLINHVIFLTIRVRDLEAKLEAKPDHNDNTSDSSVIMSSQVPTAVRPVQEPKLPKPPPPPPPLEEISARLLPMLEGRLMPRVLDNAFLVKKAAEEAKALKMNVEAVAVYQKKCVGLHRLQTERLLDVDDKVTVLEKVAVQADERLTEVEGQVSQPQLQQRPQPSLASHTQVENLQVETRHVTMLDESVLVSPAEKAEADEPASPGCNEFDETVPDDFPEDDDYFDELSLINITTGSACTTPPTSPLITKSSDLNANAPPFEPVSDKMKLPLPGRTPNKIPVQAADTAQDTIQERRDNHFSCIVSGIRIPRNVRQAAKIREIERQQVEVKIRALYPDFRPEMIGHYKALKPFDYPPGSPYSMKITFKDERCRRKILSVMGMDAIMRPYLSRAQCQRFERECDRIMQQEGIPFEPSFLFVRPSAIGGPYELHQIEHQILKRSLQPNSNNLKMMFGDKPLVEEPGPALRHHNWTPMDRHLWACLELPVQQFFNSATQQPPRSYPSMAALRDAGTAILGEELLMTQFFTDVLQRLPPRSRRGSMII